MRGKKLLLGLTVFVGVVVGLLALQEPSQALDSDRDWDKYAVVYGGMMTVSEMRSDYYNGDAEKVFAHFGISKSDISGNIKSGVVYRDGRVVVDGKTVATNASTAIRNISGGTRISNTNAKKVPTSRMGDAQTAFVKFDKDGRFEWAIMKPCGNPVTGTPTKPKPKPAAACKALTATALSRDDYRLTASASTANGASVSRYNFTIKNSDGATVKTGSVSTSSLSASFSVRDLEAGTYTASVTVTTSLGVKSDPDCATTFTVEPEDITVCDLETKESVTIKETEFDPEKHSRDFDDCKEEPIKVCDLKTKEIIQINEEEFDSSKHSREVEDCDENPCPIPGKEHLPADSPNCKEEPPVTPELPRTGIEDTVASLVGLMSLTGASAYYLTSRR